jgi:hypothetical protein
MQHPISIEILGAMLKEACLKKGESFSLIFTLFCAVNKGFVDPVVPCLG